MVASQNVSETLNNVTQEEVQVVGTPHGAGLPPGLAGRRAQTQEKWIRHQVQYQ